MMRRSATYILLHAIVFGALSCPALGEDLSAALTAGAANVLCVGGLQNDSVVFAGTGANGLYRKIAGGTGWVQSNIREGAVYSILPDPRNADHFYAGSSLGLLATTDRGGQWSTIASAVHAIALASSPNGPQFLVTADGSVVNRTVDDGKTWSTIDTLSRFHIKFLLGMPTDTGSIFFGANDTTVLYSVDKNAAVWSGLPPLPNAGTARPRITAIVYDTLSLDGTRLVAGTDLGVCVYAFKTSRWSWLNAGLPAARIGALGIIKYDMTVAERAYGYFAAIGRAASDPPANSGIFKFTIETNVAVTDSVWVKLRGDQIDVRSCFIPDHGTNPVKFYIATDDGLRVSQDGGTTWSAATLEVTPIAAFDSSAVNAGLVRSGDASIATVTIGNRGLRTLTVTGLALSNAGEFSFVSPVGTLQIDSMQTKTVQIRFAPGSAGTYTTVLSFTTNDPLLPKTGVALTGFCTGVYDSVRFGKRTIVIDTRHSGSDNVAALYADLKRAFTLAGISVIDALPATVSAKIAMIILPAPKLYFTKAESDTLKALAANGTTIVALGSVTDHSTEVLKALFTSMQAALEFRTDSIATVQGGVIAVKAPSAATVSYLAHATTLMFTSGTGLKAPANTADALFSAHGITFSGTAAGTRDTAILAGVARIGKGKIVAFGDTRFWANSAAGSMATGLWAADNFACALSMAGTIEDTASALETTAGVYSLFSVPYSYQDRSVNTVINNLGNSNPFAWRLYEWDGAAQGYVEYTVPPFSTIERGQGYWFIAKDAKTLTFGAADYTVLPEPFTFTLKPGWNLIGDPFPFAVAWFQKPKPASVDEWVWAYNSTEPWQEYVLYPYSGYFVYNDSSADVRVTLQPVPFSPPPGEGRMEKHQSVFAAGEWSVCASVTDGVVSDRENYFGMLKSASAAIDKNDLTEPPPSPGRHVALSFARNGRELAGDYRPVSQDGAVWECTVSASAAQAKLTLRFEQRAQLPAGFGIYVMDIAAETITDCTQSASYEIVLGTNETARTLRILAGDQKFIDQHRDGIPLTPLSYGLEQNYPNPWNPATTIRYTVAHSGMVVLDIFNVLGQKIKTLVNRQQALGVYTEQWNGRDDSGVEVPSGVYIYRLTTSAFVQSKRMVLVR